MSVAEKRNRSTITFPLVRCLFVRLWSFPRRRDINAPRVSKGREMRVPTLSSSQSAIVAFVSGVRNSRVAGSRPKAAAAHIVLCRRRAPMGNSSWGHYSSGQAFFGGLPFLRAKMKEGARSKFVPKKEMILTPRQTSEWLYVHGWGIRLVLRHRQRDGDPYLDIDVGDGSWWNISKT